MEGTSVMVGGAFASGMRLAVARAARRVAGAQGMMEARVAGGVAGRWWVRGNHQVSVEYVGEHEAGHMLLENPVYNKGTAFTEAERKELGLQGLLPPHVDTLREQMNRSYASYKSKGSDIERHIYLRQLQDTNETLFYALLKAHVVEMLPILYTPTVGLACQEFSHIYRRPRGLFISYPNQHEIDATFEGIKKRGWMGAPVDVDSPLDVRVIVVTDGSRILGLGDLGAGGMGIPIGKCSLYTSIGGIHPCKTLPIYLDAGTDNESALADPSYIGWRSKRVRGPEYFAFVDRFIQGVKKHFPGVLLQWEDFNIDSAGPLLHKYRDQLCSFNDDVQGTAAVAVGTLLAACGKIGTPLKDQRVVIVGSGSAGCGIANMIKLAMIRQGLSEAEARSRFYMIDRPGLLHSGIEDLREFQKPLCQDLGSLSSWSGGDGNSWSLQDVMHNAKPGVLIGVSGMPGLFTEGVVKAMASGCDRPIIFPLSNPTHRVEGIPDDIIAWTQGRATVATGTAFPPTEVEVSRDQYSRTLRRVEHSQCNNSYIFPGIGLGVVASGATSVTDNMLMASSEALASESPALKDALAPLLPSLEHVVDVTKIVAKAVAAEAIKDGVAGPGLSPDVIEKRIADTFWEPHYPDFKLFKP